MEKGELETTITYDMDQKLVRIFSAIPKDNNKLRKLKVLPDKDNGRNGCFYTIPLDQFRWTIRPPRVERVRRYNAQKPMGFRPRKGIPDEGHHNG